MKPPKKDEWLMGDETGTYLNVGGAWIPVDVVLEKAALFNDVMITLECYPPDMGYDKIIVENIRDKTKKYHSSRGKAK